MLCINQIIDSVIVNTFYGVENRIIYFDELTRRSSEVRRLSIVFHADEFLGGSGGGAAGETAGDFAVFSTATYTGSEFTLSFVLYM